MTPTADADLLAIQVFEQFVRMLRQLGTAGDLSLPAAAALARLADVGPHRLTELAAAEGLSQPGATQLVTRLERDGLARRTPCPDDGRAVLVEATDRGRDLLAQRRAQRAAALRTLIERLDPDDRDAVRRALPALERLTALAPDA